MDTCAGNLRLEISIEGDTYLAAKSLILDMKLTNVGLSPMFLFTPGLELGLQLTLEVLDDAERPLVIPPLKDIKPNLALENYMALGAGESISRREDIAPRLRSSILRLSNPIHIRVTYSSKDYGAYARMNYGLSAFESAVQSNVLILHRRPRSRNAPG